MGKTSFRCEACEAHRMPKAKRPAAVPRTYRFNHVVGVDLVDIKGMDNQRYFWLNVHCWGSAFQLVGVLQGDGRKTPENTWNTFVRTWARIFGFPDVLVCDPGGEFEGYFAEMANSNGICILPTDARSPWQNGRTERAGKEGKRPRF